MGGWRRWLERGLLAVGAACLGYWVVLSAAAQADSHYQRWRLSRMSEAYAAAADEPSTGEAGQTAPRSTLPGDAQPATAASVPPAVPGQTLLGRVRIPRVGLDAVVLEGVGSRTLSLAAGHFPESAPLGAARGNTALAGHRDGTFQALRDVEVGDEVLVTTPAGTSAYRVTWTKVVDPDDLWVIAPSRHRELTLVTCYPFAYIGHAPHRFVVRALREGDGGEARAGVQPATLVAGRTQ